MSCLDTFRYSGENLKFGGYKIWFFRINEPSELRSTTTSVAVVHAYGIGSAVPLSGLADKDLLAMILKTLVPLTRSPEICSRCCQETRLFTPGELRWLSILGKIAF